jgi:hypothetical protein
MVGATRSPTVPPKGPTIDVFCVDGGRSQISGITSQGAPSTFFALMVDAHGSKASSPRGATTDIFYVDGGRSQLSNIASQGGHR